MKPLFFLLLFSFVFTVQAQLHAVRIYPVPANSECFIDHKGCYDPYKVSISLHDITGRQYSVDYTVSDNVIKLNSGELHSGFYLLSIIQEGKHSAFA